MQLIVAFLALVFGLCVMAGVGYGIYYYVYQHGRAIAPTPAPPPTQTLDMVFFNSYTDKTIWLIPSFGTTTDAHVPRWTDWDLVSSGSTAVLIPHSSDLRPYKILPRTSIQIAVLTGGMASVNFTFRVNCDEDTMICEHGDSSLVPELDYKADGSLKRGNVPPKPAIDTRIELSWACAYRPAIPGGDPGNQEYCTINPSCIIDSPAACYTTLSQMFADPVNYPGLKIEKDGLLYKRVNGVKVQVPLPLDAVLQGNTFFDITCVDGYTTPVILQVKRPEGTLDSAESKCYTSGDRLDAVNERGWQTLANTRHLEVKNGSTQFPQCPTDEIIWRSELQSIIGVSGLSGDGYNTDVGTQQFAMPWVTGPSAKLSSSTFVPDVQFDLKIYRDPAEVAAVPSSMNFTTEDVIGCASPCSFLTKNQSASVLYPKAGGHYPTPSPYMNNTSAVLTADERGVSDVCCGALFGIDGFDSATQCITTKYWTNPLGGNPADRPPATGQAHPKYNHGWYVSDFLPASGNPWWNEVTKTSRNPYVANPDTHSKYVAALRDGKTPYAQDFPRAYSFQHDDAWSTLQCTTVNPAALHAPIDARGSFYNRYKVRVIIGDGAIPTD